MNTTEEIVKSGIKWSAAAQILIQIIKIGRWFVLLYFIGPADFGLFALSILLVSFPQTFLDQGVGSAVIQSEQIFSSKDLSTYYWLLTTYCGILLVVFFFLSSTIATFFSEPDLEKILFFLSAAYFLESIGKLPGALLRKALKFQYIAKTETYTFLIGTLITVFLAVKNYGIWALAIGFFVEYSITSISFIVKARFQPQFVFCIESLRKIYAFSRNVTLIHLTTHIMRYADDLIIGFFFGKTALGIYDRAYQIVHLPMRLITNRIILVLFPAYSEGGVSRNEIRKIHLKVIHYTSIIYFFIFVVIVTLSEPAIRLFLKEDWYDLSFYMPVLAFGGIVHAFINFNYSIFLSLDKSDLQLKYGLITRGIIVFSYVIGAFFGVKGIAVGYAVGSLIAFLPESIKALKEINITLFDFWKSIKVPFYFSIFVLFSSIMLLYLFEKDMVKLVVGIFYYLICSGAYYFIFLRTKKTTYEIH